MSKLITYIPQMYKAVSAAVAAATAAYAGLEVTGGAAALTASQWVAVIAAGAVAGLAAWLPENRSADEA